MVIEDDLKKEQKKNSLYLTGQVILVCALYTVQLLI